MNATAENWITISLTYVSRIDPELSFTVAAIVDAGSLDAAARALGITPSAVSQRLKTIEQQVGRVLVIRSRPATATAAGEAVIRMARQIALAEHDAAAALGVDSAGRVSVPLAVNADSMATWFLAPLARLAERYEIDIDLHRDDQSFTARLLESGEVMAAVTSEAEPVAGCTVTALGVLAYDAAATPAFVERWFPDGVTADSLRCAPFVDFDRRDGLQHAWLSQWGVPEKGVPRHHVPASADFVQAVRLGLGWGMLPRLQSDDALRSREVMLLGGAPVRVPLYWQQWNMRSPLLDSIAAEVAAEAAAVLDR